MIDDDQVQWLYIGSLCCVRVMVDVDGDNHENKSKKETLVVGLIYARDIGLCVCMCV